MHRFSALPAVIAVCTITAGCGSSSHSGFAAQKASSSGSGASSSSYQAGYSPVSALQFQEIELCAQAADGGDDAGKLIAGVQANSEQSFSTGSASAYLYASQSNATYTVKQLQTRALNESSVREYGNVLVNLPVDDTDNANITALTDCIHNIYTGEEQQMTIAAHPEFLFGHLREWATAHGYEWNNVITAEQTSDHGSLSIDHGAGIHYAAVANLTAPNGMPIFVYATESSAAATRLVANYADRTQTIDEATANCGGPVCGAYGHPNTREYHAYPGATARAQFAIIPQNLVSPNKITTIPATQVRAVAQGLSDAPAAAGAAASGVASQTESSHDSTPSAPIPPADGPTDEASSTTDTPAAAVRRYLRGFAEGHWDAACAAVTELAQMQLISAYSQDGNSASSCQDVLRKLHGALSTSDLNAARNRAVVEIFRTRKTAQVRYGQQFAELELHGDRWKISEFDDSNG